MKLPDTTELPFLREYVLLMIQGGKFACVVENFRTTQYLMNDLRRALVDEHFIGITFNPKACSLIPNNASGGFIKFIYDGDPRRFKGIVFDDVIYFSTPRAMSRKTAAILESQIR